MQAEATPPVFVPLQFKDVHGSCHAAAEDGRDRLVPLVDREAAGLRVREEPILERSSKFRRWPHPTHSCKRKPSSSGRVVGLSLASGFLLEATAKNTTVKQMRAAAKQMRAAAPYNPPDLAFAPGTRLGVYEIVAHIGEGGMGLVYRARDTKLNRDVAIKVLPDAFATDTDRLARFTREAQTLASLNHPNIAHIHGLEESGGVRALVMELVEGEDLSQRIARGAIPVDEALPVAKQIAEALEGAHQQGIVHRDLKPANIKLRPDGTVKVLDFGLAKALAPEQDPSSGAHRSQSPTITSPAMLTAWASS